jgi:hypothetical protein
MVVGHSNLGEGELAMRREGYKVYSFSLCLDDGRVSARIVFFGLVTENNVRLVTS